ncbi:MAG: response regulator [Syntrophales bacterium]|nr:response regulator [Syntrophales bacterium]
MLNSESEQVCKSVHTILVADDNATSRGLISELLSTEGYQVLESNDGNHALSILEKERIDVVLMDVIMPGMDGYEACRRIKGNPKWCFIPVVMLTALKDVESRIKALEAGADDFISKPFHEEELVTRVKSSARSKELLDQLEDTESILFALANVVEVKDQYTERHLKSMARFAEQLAGLAGLSVMDQRMVRYGGILHDIGKVGISDSILCKQGMLTMEEYEIIKMHTILGEQIVEPMRFGSYVAPMVRGHHERWDGTGYPDGLSGQKIPIGARILSICDSYDAMTSDRPYRRALSVEEAKKELLMNSGAQFDPDLVRIFVSSLKDICG